MITAPRANDYSIEYYDHNIIRPNQDQFLDEDRFAIPHLIEKFFIKTSYIFTLIIFDKMHNHIISEALADIKAYETFYDKFQLFSLIFHFLSLVICTIPTISYCELNKRTPTHIFVLYKIIMIYTNHHDNPTTNISF